MLVSKVETGLRLAMPTMVCAARWKTVSISYSPRTRFEQGLVADVAADDLDPIDEAGADQLRAGHPVADQADDVGPGVAGAVAPASRRPARWRPVTSVGRSRQKAAFIPRPSMRRLRYC